MDIYANLPTYWDMAWPFFLIVLPALVIIGFVTFVVSRVMKAAKKDTYTANFIWGASIFLIAITLLLTFLMNVGVPLQRYRDAEPITQAYLNDKYDVKLSEDSISDLMYAKFNPNVFSADHPDYDASIIYGTTRILQDGKTMTLELAKDGHDLKLFIVSEEDAVEAPLRVEMSTR